MTDSADYLTIDVYDHPWSMVVDQERQSRFTDGIRRPRGADPYRRMSRWWSSCTAFSSRDTSPGSSPTMCTPRHVQRFIPGIAAASTSLPGFRSSTPRSVSGKPPSWPATTPTLPAATRTRWSTPELPRPIASVATCRSDLWPVRARWGWRRPHSPIFRRPSAHSRTRRRGHNERYDMSTWKDTPTRKIRANGVDFAYREVGTDAGCSRGLPAPPDRGARRLGSPSHRRNRRAPPRHRLRQSGRRRDELRSAQRTSTRWARTRSRSSGRWA